MRKKAHRPNYKLITIFAIILIFGLVMLTSASQIIGLNKFHDPYYYFKHQLLFGILPGSIFLIICSIIYYKTWQKWALPIFVLSIILLISVFIPQLSYEHGGANRWLYLGFSLQPSELVKLALVIFLSAWFVKKKNEITSPHYTLAPFLMYLGIITLLIALEPDIGTLLVIITIALAIYWTAGAKTTHIAIIILIGSLTFGLLIKAAPYRTARITAFLNPKADTQGISYQINQSLIAVGSGGLFGQGLGQSRQKYQYLPETAGDSVFAIIAEELGFIPTSLFILTYLYFIVIIFQTAIHAPDDFSRLTATGIGTWLAFQALINIAAMVKISPLTGLPLPFVSYGSSAIITSMAAIGIIINISKHTKPS